MLLARLNAAAGPSRVALARSFGVAANLRPITAPARIIAAAPIRSTAAARWASTTTTTDRAAPAPKPPAPTSRIPNREWPWYPVEPPVHRGQVEEERVIYARKPVMNAAFLMGCVILVCGGLIVWLNMPDTPQMKYLRDKAERQAKKKEAAERVARGERPMEEEEEQVKDDEDEEIPVWVSGSWTVRRARDLALSGLLVALAGGLIVYTSRQVTRLSLVRSYPIGQTPPQPKYFLRMDNRLRSIFSWAKPRDLSLDKVKMNLILEPVNKEGTRGRTQFLKMTIGNQHPRLTQRLDFTPPPGATDPSQELVMSVKRVEAVFGTLKPTWGEVDPSKKASEPPKKAVDHPKKGKEEKKSVKPVARQTQKKQKSNSGGSSK